MFCNGVSLETFKKWTLKLILHDPLCEVTFKRLIFTNSAPLGRVSLVVAMSVLIYLVPFPWNFFEASHLPWDHMISSRPPIGQPKAMNRSIFCKCSGAGKIYKQGRAPPKAMIGSIFCKRDGVGKISKQGRAPPKAMNECIFCKRGGVGKISKHYGVGNGSVPCQPLFLFF